MSFLSIFTGLETPDFSWMKEADVDSLVGFGCLICFGVAVAFGV